MKNFFGLDFGTTNSALSVNIDGKVEILDIDQFNIDGLTMKSVLYFDEDEKMFHFGQDAVDRYIENDACGRYVQSIKSFLPNKLFSSTSFGSKSYKLDELVAVILREIKERGQKCLGLEINNVVLGRPVVFSEDSESDKLAEDRLISAAKKAGFKKIHLQKEPIAAAFAYEESYISGDQKIALVGDFGGGTSDFAVVKVGGKSKISGSSRDDDVLSVSGVHVGGDDFDSLIMWEKISKYFGRLIQLRTMESSIKGTDDRIDMAPTIYRQLCEWHLIPRLNTPKTMEYLIHCKYLAVDSDKQLIENLINLIEDNYGYMLFRSIESAKKDLSRLNDAVVLFEEMDLLINEIISRNQFEIIIEKEVAKIKTCIKESLVRAEISASQVDVIVLTGGSSHIPCIRKIFTEIFVGKEIVHSNAFTGVAYGLGSQNIFQV